MEFKWVLTEDWYGIIDRFKIINLVKKDYGYVCIFINSKDGIERAVIKDEQDLFQ